MEIANFIISIRCQFKDFVVKKKIITFGKGHGAKELCDLVAESTHARTEHNVSFGINIKAFKSGHGRHGGSVEEEDQEEEM